MTAQAATYFSRCDFDLTIPALNGYVSTGYVQKKSHSGSHLGQIIVEKAGSQVFDARMEDKGGQRGAWTRQIGKGGALLAGHSQHYQNEMIRLGLNWNARDSREAVNGFLIKMY